MFFIEYIFGSPFNTLVVLGYFHKAETIDKEVVYLDTLGCFGSNNNQLITYNEHVSYLKEYIQYIVDYTNNSICPINAQ